MGVRTFLSRVGRVFNGYDAVTRTGTFRRGTVSRGSEDNELTRQQRDQLTTQARDLNRNFGVAGFCVRRYLDFCASFTFRSITKYPDGKPATEWNRECEAYLDWASEPLQFDAAGRHSLRRALRLAETRRVIDGDIGLLRLQDGSTQFIESDLIRQPETAALVGAETLDRWFHGVKVDERGRTLAYAIHRRDGGKYVFDRTVAASRLWLHAHYDSGRFDQVRGISRFASSLNTLRHVYEGIDANLAKAKLQALMGMAIFREVEDDLIDADEDEECGEDPLADWQFDPDKGPFTLKLNAKDKVDLLESRTPSGEFQSFTKLCLILGLSALDIPMAVLDTSESTYAGLQAAMTLLIKASEEPRRDNRALLNKWTRFRLGLAIARGDLDPGKYGLTFDDLRWSWTSAGVPFFDKSKQIEGDAKAMAARIQSPGMVIEERLGLRFEDVIDRIAEEEAYMREKGVSLPSVGSAGSATPPANSTDGNSEDQ